MKVIRLTAGGLTDAWSEYAEMRLKKIYREKSAEAIVASAGAKNGL